MGWGGQRGAAVAFLARAHGGQPALLSVGTERFGLIQAVCAQQRLPRVSTVGGKGQVRVSAKSLSNNFLNFIIKTMKNIYRT